MLKKVILSIFLIGFVNNHSAFANGIGVGGEGGSLLMAAGNFDQLQTQLQANLTDVTLIDVSLAPHEIKNYSLKLKKNTLNKIILENIKKKEIQIIKQTNDFDDGIAFSIEDKNIILELNK